MFGGYPHKSCCHVRGWQAREFANELRAQVKVSRAPGAWLEGSGGGSLGSGSDTSNVSDAYAKMLRIFIPLLVDEVGRMRCTVQYCIVFVLITRFGNL